MSIFNQLSTDSIPVTRRKYVTSAKRNYIKSILSAQNLHNETFSSEILGSNAQTLNLSEAPFSELNLGNIKSFPVYKDSQDYNEIAKERTQDSINISSSIEETEVENGFGQISNEKDKIEPVQERSCRKGFIRNAKLRVSTNLRELEEDGSDFCKSNESTPHLYVEYADRLKNILLEYFDE